MIVLAADGNVLSHFSAGEVTLEGVDTDEEGALVFDETITVVREPDSVAWIDNTHFATANEGDMDGGSRGWTIFSQDGDVVYESGVEFEHAIIQAGPLPGRTLRQQGRRAGKRHLRCLWWHTLCVCRCRTSLDCRGLQRNRSCQPGVGTVACPRALARKGT